MECGRVMSSLFRYSIYILAFFVVNSLVHGDDNAPQRGFQCSALANLDLVDTTITLVELLPKGNFLAPDGASFILPSFCRVTAIAKTSSQSDIGFEVWLPSSNWNGRYHQYDIGGVRDHISYPSFAWRLSKGDVIAQVDTIGTWDEDESNKRALQEDSFAAFRDAEKVFDLTRGHRVAAKRAKAITKAYYQKPPHHSYFTGCSGGGYSALLEAQRNPEAWDGILAGAPANYILQLLLGTYAWTGQQWENKAGRIPPQKLPLIQKTALSFCTEDAHVVDGVATDPRFCRYDPAVLLCQGEDRNDCLTAEQVKTLENIYQGPRLGTGEQIYPGFPAGMEAEISPAWGGSWMLGTTGGVVNNKAEIPRSYNVFKKVYRNFISEGSAWSAESFNFDRDYPRAFNKRLLGQSLNSILNADSPDLSSFQAKGGRLLIYHGWGDENQPPQGGIDYYKNVSKYMGGHHKTQEFMRLFMVPGFMHCVGGPGANAFGQYGNEKYSKALKDDSEHDIVRALEAWVEKGRVPEQIIAAKYIRDKPELGVKFTRPLCPYPSIAIYQGKGDVNSTDNFRCKVHRKGLSE